jgi:hypothetical protein
MLLHAGLYRRQAPCIHEIVCTEFVKGLPVRRTCERYHMA